ncbi:MAG: hypothetical protein K8R74_13010, partial [Bacteroidales bacterium]|nr:hypothetical protein [Bacteroidales bacterium]
KLNEFKDEMECILNESVNIDESKMRNLYDDYKVWSKSELEKEDTELIAKLRPEIKIEIFENNKSNIRVEITSIKESSEKIENLFLKFDLPGVFDSITQVYKERIGNYKITPSFLCGSGYQTDAQTIHISIQDLYSTGYLAFSIIYKPTLIRYQRHAYFETYSTPLMDLHDISKYSIFWKFKGIHQKDDYYLNLSYLECFKNDNEQLLRQIIRRKAPLNEYLKSNGVMANYIKSQLNQGKKNFIFKVDNKLPIYEDEMVEIKNDTIYWTEIMRPFINYTSIEDVWKMELKRKDW